MATRASSRGRDYDSFIKTWAPHCGAPAEVFIGQLDVTFARELGAVLGRVGAQQLPDLIRAVAGLLGGGRYPGVRLPEMDDRAWVQIEYGQLEAVERALEAYDQALVAAAPLAAGTVIEIPRAADVGNGEANTRG